MEEIKNKGFIAKKEKGAGQYQNFHQKGIELLQKLSGETWTDYNEHDPGVTILENLSYTLTNLFYKAGLPIRDILTESKGSMLESGDNGFFIPSEILTTNPVTLNDFKKIIIDQVENVKNVWIENNLNSQKDDQYLQKNILGLYTIEIELQKYESNKDQLLETKKKVTAEVKRVFYKHRNLCEDLHSIIVLEPIGYKLDLAITLIKDANGEDVFANIYYNIGEYLSQNIKVRTLWELQEQGENINSIYEGPLLENGFIRDSELKERRKTVLYREITKIIQKEEGVASIDHYSIRESDDAKPNGSSKEKNEEINIVGDHVPFLIAPNSKSDLHFISDSVSFTPNIEALLQRINYLRALNYCGKTSASNSLNIIEIPKGNDLGISSYYTIRNQFPAVYSVGEMGLPKSAPDMRHAQVKQLKAYLLPYDQLMANFVSQLTNIYKLYDVQGENLQSYFYQELEDLPQLTDLIKSNAQENEGQTIENWKNTLKELNDRQDVAAIDRLNHIADNLLARFAEVFPAYALKKVNTHCYNKNIINDSFDKNLLKWKRSLIKNYQWLSYNRAKGVNHTSEIALSDFSDSNLNQDKFTPAIVQKIALQMGIDSNEIRRLAKLVEDSGILDKKSETVFEVIEGVQSDAYKIIEGIELTFEEHKDLANGIFKLCNNDLSLALKNGILKEKYTINKHNDHYDIKFEKDERTEPINYSVATIARAKDAVTSTVQFFRNLDINSEGMHLVEHLLLTPPYDKAFFGFQFSVSIPEQKSISFHQEELKTYEDRNQSVNHIIEEFSKPICFKARIGKENGGYRIRMFYNETYFAQSGNYYLTEEKARQKALLIEEYIQKCGNQAIINSFEHYAYYNESRVNEEFFSFKMSFIMPSWPVRFQNEHFRTKFDEATFENSPAHITCDKFWLDIDTLKDFEDCYYKWIKSYSIKEQKDDTLLNSYKLIEFLHKIKKN